MAGCAGKKDAPDVISNQDSRSQTVRQGLELQARDEGGRIYLSLTNHGPGSALAGPKNFAIVTQPDREVTPFHMGTDSSQLPVRRLEPGETIKGYLRFAKFDSTVGEWLFYQSSDVEPQFARCVIQATGATSTP